ncbi:MAG: ABC transporter permease [Polyangiaceae bacterium]|nr:ABC transporter permease [Polyangiaceae bacterium]
MTDESPQAHKPAPAGRSTEPAKPVPAAKPGRQGTTAALPKDPGAKAPATAAPAPEQPGAPPWWRTLRADAPLLVRVAIGLAALGVLGVVWWFVTRGDPTEAIVSPAKLKSPGQVFGSFAALLERDLVGNILATLWRVLVGVGLGALVGIGLGVGAGSYRSVAAAINPAVIFLRSVPMGALLPFTIYWFGIYETQKSMFIFLAVVPFVFSDTVKAISAVPQRYVETAQTLGASRFQIIRKVLFPLAVPDIVTSLRFQFGLALGYITLAEAINPTAGIGFLLNSGEREGHLEQNYLLLFIIALIALGIDLGIRFFQRGLFHYRKDL